MACGTPVIGANVGGIKFSVRDAETGYLVASKDEQALADRLAHLYRHPDLRASFGQQGIRRVHALFTWQHVVNAIAALYDEVLALRRLSGADRGNEVSLIDDSFLDCIRTMEESRLNLRGPILEAAGMISACFARGGKVLIAGNGGSAADAQHFACEFVGRFKATDRPGLPALALYADTAILTAWSNDIGYESVFSRQLEALGSPGDVFIGISTSGRSPNLIRAFEAARNRGIRSVGILGGTGGDCLPIADIPVVVPASDTQHIQEVQIFLIHLLCDLVERRLVHAGAHVSPVSAHKRRSDRHRTVNMIKEVVA
jgi:phosphoheptose isomerase